MVRRTATSLFSRRYAVAWVYLGLYGIFAVIYTFLTAGDHAGLIAWSSTNLVNLHRNAAGSLLASAFIPGNPAIAWVALGCLGLFTVNALLGTARTVLLLVTGHVAGTLVSEGIIGYRVDHALLPPSARTIVDVGPSYVVVCALVVAILYGSRTQRLAAGAGFAVVAPHIFRGLTQLDVTPVGHLTAVATGAVLGTLLWHSARRADRDRAERSRVDRDRADHGRAERDRADHGRAERDRAEHGSAEHGSAEHGSAEHGSAEHGSAEHGSAEHSGAEHGSAEHSGAEHGSAEHSGAEHGSAEHGSAEHSRAERYRAEHSRAGHSRAGHSRAGHSRAEHSRAERYRAAAGRGRAAQAGPSATPP